MGLNFKYRRDNILEPKKYKTTFKNPTIVIDKNYKIKMEPKIICYKEREKKGLKKLGIAVFTMKKDRTRSVLFAFLEKENFSFGNLIILKNKIIPTGYLVYVDLANGYAWLVGRKAKPIHYVKVDEKLIAKNTFYRRRK